MKGIILAGGNGTRLHPLTRVYQKQLLLIYDKPMIFYSLSLLLECGITDICIITKSVSVDAFQDLLGDGKEFGARFTYLIQDIPRGIPEAIEIAKYYLKKDDFVLVLGDTLMYGEKVKRGMIKAKKELEKSLNVIFEVPVKDSSEFGSVIYRNNKAVEIREKDKNNKQGYAIPGIYYYKNSVIDLVQELKPSDRNELEISDLNNRLLSKNELMILRLEGDSLWIDTGTPDNILFASNLVASIQNATGNVVGNIEIN